jgi:hypothetical protein
MTSEATHAAEAEHGGQCFQKQRRRQAFDREAASTRFEE